MVIYKQDFITCVLVDSGSCGWFLTFIITGRLALPFESFVYGIIRSADYGLDRDYR